VAEPKNLRFFAEDLKIYKENIIFEEDLKKNKENVIFEEVFLNCVNFLNTYQKNLYPIKFEKTTSSKISINSKTAF